MTCSRWLNVDCRQGPWTRGRDASVTGTCKRCWVQSQFRRKVHFPRGRAGRRIEAEPAAVKLVIPTRTKGRLSIASKSSSYARRSEASVAYIRCIFTTAAYKQATTAAFQQAIDEISLQLKIFRNLGVKVESATRTVFQRS